MAIILEEKQQFNWKATLTIAAIIAFVIGLSYFLFFAPVPATEIIKPAALKTADELSKVEFDPASIINSDGFRSLRRFAEQPSVGNQGRENPFVKF